MRVEIRTNFKNELMVILYEINDLLTVHIDIHNNIFRPKKSLFSVFTKKIDFESLHVAADRVKGSLAESLESLSSLAETATEEERSLCEDVKQYAISFLSSVSKLGEIANELYLKSNNRNKLSYSEYNHLVTEYQDTEQKRVEHSQMMNNVVGKIQHI